MTNDPDFIAAFNAIRKEMLAAARAQLRFMATRATRTLRSLMSKANPPAIRLKAAQAVLELAMAEDLGKTQTDPDDIRATLARRDSFRGLSLGGNGPLT